MDFSVRMVFLQREDKRGKKFYFWEGGGGLSRGVFQTEL